MLLSYVSICRSYIELEVEACVCWVCWVCVCVCVGCMERVRVKDGAQERIYQDIEFSSDVCRDHRYVNCFSQEQDSPRLRHGGRRERAALLVQIANGRQVVNAQLNCLPLEWCNPLTDREANRSHF